MSIRQILSTGLVFIIIVASLYAVHEVTTNNQQLRLKSIELRDVQAELNKLESDYKKLENDHSKSEAEKAKLREKLNDKQRQLEKTLEENKALQARRLLKAQEAKAYAASRSTAVRSSQLASGCTALRSQMASLGVSGANLDAAITLAMRESSCNHYARNASSGACGAFQSLPCGKWGSPGTTEYLRGAIRYANERYGSYVNALAHSYSHGWY